MDMVERVARAMAVNNWPVDFPGTKAQFVQSHWKYHEDDARAAIEAMREPTQVMQEAGYVVTVDDEVEVWQAMIDAALSPKP